MSRACRLLSLILVLAAAPALGDDSTIKTFKEPKVLDTPQATGRAWTDAPAHRSKILHASRDTLELSRHPP